MKSKELIIGTENEQFIGNDGGELFEGYGDS